MTIISTVVIVPNAVDESDALEKAEEILEVSAVDPYGEGELNPFGRWESFGIGWGEYKMPVDTSTHDETEAIQVKNLDIRDFFFDPEEDEFLDDEPDEFFSESDTATDFIPEALVHGDGTWSDSETLEPGTDWTDYFIEAIQNLPQDAWIVCVEAAC